VTVEGGPVPRAPTVTVSLVTFDGHAWMAGLLGSLAAQELTDYELVVRDNASRDGCADLARSLTVNDPRVRVIESERNLGYAAAHDLTIAGARSEVIVLLNQDVELDRGFLAAVVDAFERHPRVGAVQARIRRLAGPGVRVDTLDTTGLVMGRDRRAFSRGRGRQDSPAVETPGPVWGADGPAPAYRRAALMDARLPRRDGTWEVLDRDFFMNKEDVDVAWRLRLLGWEAWYEPTAIAWHARGTGDSGATGLRDIARANRAIGSAARVGSWRNQRVMQLKNERVGEVLRDLPWLVGREGLTLAYLAIVDPRALSAVLALVRAAPAALRKRRYLQARIRDGRGRVPSERRPASGD
jgi:GT2 family glycosyltransferase